jgi:hypothetical protein
MTATYTFDVFTSLDGFGAHSGNWGKQGPDLLARRFALYEQDQRMVFGANTYRAHAKMLAASRRARRGGRGSARTSAGCRVAGGAAAFPATHPATMSADYQKYSQTWVLVPLHGRTPTRAPSNGVLV